MSNVRGGSHKRIPVAKKSCVLHPPELAWILVLDGEYVILAYGTRVHISGELIGRVYNQRYDIGRWSVVLRLLCRPDIGRVRIEITANTCRGKEFVALLDLMSFRALVLQIEPRFAVGRVPDQITHVAFNMWRCNVFLHHSLQVPNVAPCSLLNIHMVKVPTVHR